MSAWGYLFLRLAASTITCVAGATYMREALTHPSFTKLRYRIVALFVIMAALLLIFCAIWL